MLVFITIFFKLMSAFGSILLGFIAGKWLQIDRDNIARLLFFLMTPLVVFYNVALVKINLHILSFPLLTYVIACSICTAFYYIAANIWQDSTRNILAFTAGNGNTGYFALPVVITIFEHQVSSIFVMGMLGVMLYEYSLGFFITARSHQTIGESVVRVLKLPMLYSFVLGCIYSMLHLTIPQIFEDFMRNILGCYSTLGMMLVGLGLAQMNTVKLDFKFISLAFLARFVVWPLISFLIIFVDKNFIQYYDQNVYSALLMLSVVPLAANTVVVASILKVQPEKSAAAVLLSTIVALFYMPLFIYLFVHSDKLLK